jgi:hypothetical protein
MFTPFYMMYGREANTPSIDWIDLKATSESDEDYVAKLITVLQGTWTQVANKKPQEVATFNRPPQTRIPFKEYSVGQLIFIRAIPNRSYIDWQTRNKYTISTKLQYRFVGPYTITEKHSPVLYTIQMDGKNRRVHAINMKPGITPRPDTLQKMAYAKFIAETPTTPKFVTRLHTIAEDTITEDQEEEPVPVPSVESGDAVATEFEDLVDQQSAPLGGQHTIGGGPKAQAKQLTQPAHQHTIETGSKHPKRIKDQQTLAGKAAKVVKLTKIQQQHLKAQLRHQTIPLLQASKATTPVTQVVQVPESVPESTSVVEAVVEAAVVEAAVSMGTKKRIRRAKDSRKSTKQKRAHDPATTLSTKISVKMGVTSAPLSNPGVTSVEDHGISEL